MAKKQKAAQPLTQPAPDAAAAGALREGDRARSSPRSSAARIRYSLPKLEKIVVSMGVASAIDRQEASWKKPSTALARDHRPEAGSLQGAEEHRRLPAARRHGRRLQGDASRAADVRVPGPADFARPAARARLPRPEAERLRRQRQLQPGPQRTARVPRAQSGQVHARAGHEHHDLSARRDSNDESRELLRGLGMPFQREGAAA